MANGKAIPVGAVRIGKGPRSELVTDALDRNRAAIDEAKLNMIASRLGANTMTTMTEVPQTIDTILEGEK